jgi:hypothetical protein
MEHEHPAGEGRDEARQRERQELRSRGTQAEGLRVAFVLACRDQVADRARSLQPANGDDDEQEREHAHEVEAAFGMGTVGADPDVPERRPLREARDPIEEVVGQVVELDTQQALVAVQQERRRRDGKRERGDGEHQPPDTERR